MSNLNKKWSELSKEESQAAKKKYGSRSAWQEAKSRTQTRATETQTQAPASNRVDNVGANAPGAKAGGQNSNVLRTYADGRVHYKDGVITTDRGKYDAMQKQRSEAKKSAPAPQKSKKQIAYEKRESRRASAYAYQQSRKDMQAAKRAGTEGKNTFAVDDTDFYKQRKERTGSYSKNEDRNNAISGLIGTGQKFGSLDVQRELANGGTHGQKNLYKAYGGIENYKQNYSVGSGNYQSRYQPDEYMTSKEAQGVRDQRQKQLGSWLSGEGAENYGQYDWFQKQMYQFDQMK